MRRAGFFCFINNVNEIYGFVARKMPELFARLISIFIAILENNLNNGVESHKFVK